MASSARALVDVVHRPECLNEICGSVFFHDLNFSVSMLLYYAFYRAIEDALIL